MTENGPDSLRISMDAPLAQGKKKRKKRLKQNEEETEQLESGEAVEVGFWRRCCKFCGH